MALLFECPDCGAEVRKDLSTRIHHGHNCGSIKPRDVASGQVLCTRGQRVVEMACGGDAAGAGVTQSSLHPLKPEIFGATHREAFGNRMGISRHTRSWLLGEDVKYT